MIWGYVNKKYVDYLITIVILRTIVVVALTSITGLSSVPLPWSWPSSETDKSVAKNGTKYTYPVRPTVECPS